MTMFNGEHYLHLWLYQPIRDHVMNGAQGFIQIALCNRRDYSQLIHGSSASVKPLACGGNKPHVQCSSEEGVTVTCPRCLRMVEYYTNTPRLRRRLVSLAKKPSTALSQ